MKANPAYCRLSGEFWAYVKLVSERIGYAAKKQKNSAQNGLRRFTVSEVSDCLEAIKLKSDKVAEPATKKPTPFGQQVCDYLNYRADILEQVAEPNLMTRDQAKIEFDQLRARLNPTCPLPMNKQKKEKRHHAYMMCIVNMLTEEALAGRSFAWEPRRLTLSTKDKRPIRTGSRWMDGAYPDVIDPVAVWEVKEHYGTTTFGSRVSAAVYETMLDGYEFSELHANEGTKVEHYLIVDDHFTWWVKGRPYLCRIVDTLHCGLLDEALFGKEVLTRWPQIVASWP